MKKNYYEILDIPSDVTEDEIKKAYRKKAKQYHPDKNQTSKDGEEMKTINEAYQVLSNAQKRLKYDYINGFKMEPTPPQEEPATIEQDEGFPWMEFIKVAATVILIIFVSGLVAAAVSKK